MAKTMLTMDLPKVGDRLMRLMNKASFDPSLPYNPEPCVVTYVNETHHWYQVKFTNSGIRECYNLPVFDHSILYGITWEAGTMPVLCVETGAVYSSLHCCALDLGVTHGEISRQLAGEREHCKGYHFSTVL